MNRTALIVAYAIADLIFVGLIIAGLRKGTHIRQLLPAIVIVLLSNSLWLMFAIRKKR
jgi:choline-glycine betaine transporter